MTGDDLRKAMQRAGITNAVLAERLGVSLDTVSSWRQGRRSPCCDYMAAALEAALTTATVDEQSGGPAGSARSGSRS